MSTSNLIRHDWNFQQVEEIYNLPLLDLVYRAADIHRKFHDSTKMNLNTLISVKTGACSQDCKYCAQSAKYNTNIKSSKLSMDEVMNQAKIAKANGVKRVCLSSSGRDGNNEKQFSELIDMVKQVQKLDLEVCCTMGMLDYDKAQRLADVGIKAVNHNIDTSENFYPQIVSTRSFQDRINTLKNLQKAGVNYCSGGIIGMGESNADRISMLISLANQEKHPYTVPLNSLMPIEGTPFEERTPVDIFEMARIIATARILMPKSVVSFAAGRTHYSAEGQALCYLAGANAIFHGGKLLTVQNMDANEDELLLKKLGMKTTILNEETIL
ncbi:MAG: biotin synthase BioB [Marinifilaceae bacterium]|jgi:biotin synthase|nr:biotin synthase BioB [Marinifilaceae bacterium]